MMQKKDENSVKIAREMQKVLLCAKPVTLKKHDLLQRTHEAVTL